MTTAWKRIKALDKLKVEASNNPGMLTQLECLKIQELNKQLEQEEAEKERTIASTKKNKTVERKKEMSQSMVTTSGLLNGIDGVGSPEGYVLMMTTNREKALDPALVRAGRVDIKVPFNRASREQAKALFINMYQPIVTDDEDREPPFQIKEIPRLAEEFAARVTSGKATCAQLQHFVLLHKTKP